MPPHRLEKINELIKQELGKIIFNEEDFGLGVLATILAAETSEDLRHCGVTVSVFPDKAAPKIMEKLQRHVYFLQQQLNQKLKMHPVPQIRFILNKTESESEKIERLIEKNKE